MRSSRKEVGDSATTGPKNMYCALSPKCVATASCSDPLMDISIDCAGALPRTLPESAAPALTAERP